MRLDAYLSSVHGITRAKAKQMIERGMVSLNGKTAEKPDSHPDRFLRLFVVGLSAGIRFRGGPSGRSRIASYLLVSFHHGVSLVGRDDQS